MAKLYVKNRYGQAPVELLNNPNLSLKAKGLWVYIQSKPDGWRFSIQRMKHQLKEGTTAIQRAIKELEDAKLLVRVPRRNAQGKWEGYDYVLMENPLTENPLTENPLTENPSTANTLTENPLTENPSTANTLTENPLTSSNIDCSKKEYSNIDCSKNSDSKDNLNIIPAEFSAGICATTSISSTSPGTKPEGRGPDTNTNSSGSAPGTDKKSQSPGLNGTKSNRPADDKLKEYLPLARYLAKIILKKKNFKFTPSQIRSWANEFRLLVEKNGVDKRRVKKALKWYNEHIGEPYVPVIESGRSFRAKFLKLENAMQRDNKQPHKNYDPDEEQVEEFENLRTARLGGKTPSEWIEERTVAVVYTDFPRNGS